MRVVPRSEKFTSKNAHCVRIFCVALSSMLKNFVSFVTQSNNTIYVFTISAKSVLGKRKNKIVNENY